MSEPVVLHIAEAAAGGVATHLELLARTLRGFRLHFAVSSRRDPGVPERLARAPQTESVKAIGMLRRPAPLTDYLALRQLVKLIRQLRPDLVHTHSSKGGYLGRKAAYLCGVPAVHTPHVFAFEWARLPGVKTLFRLLEKRAARWCEKLVLLSDWQLETAFQNRIAPLEKLEVIPNGVDSAFFRPGSRQEKAAARAALGLEDNALVVGTAARLSPQKGLRDFLTAAKMIAKQKAEAVFLIAGEGAQEKELRRYADALGVSPQVRFCGNLAEMLPFYRALDCFVLSSLWEGLPYVILEAQACGLPVISTDTSGGAAAIRHEESGLLVAKSDTLQLAGAILRVLDDGELAKKLGSWGRVEAEKSFSLNRWADDLAGLYRKVLDQTKL